MKAGKTVDIRETILTIAPETTVLACSNLNGENINTNTSSLLPEHSFLKRTSQEGTKVINRGVWRIPTTSGQL